MKYMLRMIHHPRTSGLLSGVLFFGAGVVTPLYGAEGPAKVPPALPWNIIKGPALPGVEHHSFASKVVGQQVGYIDLYLKATWDDAEELLKQHLKSGPAQKP